MTAQPRDELPRSIPKRYGAPLIMVSPNVEKSEVWRVLYTNMLEV